MGAGRFIHLIGGGLLLAATVLLLVADISAPVIDNLALFQVDFHDNNDYNHLNLGTFGYCLTGDNGRCSGSRIGYNPADLLNDVAGADFGSGREDTIRALTHVMVLHAVATATAFIAFLLSIFSGVFGALLASVVSAITFLLIALSVICDFTSFSMIRSELNDDDIPEDVSTNFGPALWCVLLAAVLSLIATVLVFFTCCSNRRSDRRGNRHSNGGLFGYNKDTYVHPPPVAPVAYTGA